jgi:hypothetical protein
VKKLIIVTIILIGTINLNSSTLVIKASKDIQYKSIVNSSVVHLDYVEYVKSTCTPITKDEILNFKYRAKQTLKTNRIICKKDLYIAQENRVIFKFGTIEIEKDGKVIKETKKYIRFRNTDGKIEKIYKDGWAK